MKCFRCKKCKCNEKTFNGKSKKELRRLFEDAAIEKGIVIKRNDEGKYQ